MGLVLVVHGLAIDDAELNESSPVNVTIFSAFALLDNLKARISFPVCISDWISTSTNMGVVVAIIPAVFSARSFELAGVDSLFASHK